MSRTLRIKNKIVLATSTKGYTPITSPKITKKRLSSSRPAVAAGKLGTTTQPYRPTRRKSRVLRTTKTTPQCKIYSAPAVALRIRKESSEDWAYRVHDVSTTDELESRLHAGRRPPFNDMPQPEAKYRGLVRMAPRLLTYGRKHKLATQVVLTETSSRPRAGNGLPSGDRLHARVVACRVSPRWLAVLRQLGYFPAGSYLYKRSVFSKIRRVRIVPQHPEQVISSAVRKGLPRRINQTRAMHHVKAMARPRKYTRYKYRRSLLRCKASTKRTRRRTSRRLRSQRRILPRRIGRWRTRPLAKRLRKKLLLSRYVRIQRRQVRLKSALLKRARLKRARVRRVRSKRVLARKARQHKRLPRVRRRKTSKRFARRRSTLRRARRGQRRINTHKRLRSYRRAGRLARRQLGPHLVAYKEGRGEVFLTSYRAMVSARTGLRARKMLRSPWWRASRAWFFGVRPYFIREIRRSIRRGRPRYRLRRKIRRSRYRKARRHARSVWGRANYLRYYRKGRYRQYYRRRRLSFTGLVRKGLPRNIKILIRRLSARYRNRYAMRRQSGNASLLRRRVSRSRRRVTRRIPARRHVVRKHRNRRFPRTRRALGKFLFKKSGKQALWLRVAALQSKVLLRPVRQRPVQQALHSALLIGRTFKAVKPPVKKVIDLRRTKGGMVYGLRTVFSTLAYTRPARRQTRLRLRRERAERLARLRAIRREWKQRSQLWGANTGQRVNVGGPGSKTLVRIIAKVKQKVTLIAANTQSAQKNQPPVYAIRYRPKGQAAALRGTRRRSLFARLTADIRSFESGNPSKITPHRKSGARITQDIKKVIPPKR